MNCNRIDLPPINKTCLKWQGKALNSSIPSSLQSFVDEASIIKLIGDLSSTCYSNLIGEYGWCYTIHGLQAWGYCSRSCMMGQNPMDKELVCVGPHSVWKSHELQYFPAAKLKLPFDFGLGYQSSLIRQLVFNKIRLPFSKNNTDDFPRFSSSLR